MKCFINKIMKILHDDILETNGSHIEIIAGKQIIIENHKGILEYSDTLMRINLGKMVARVTGANLELKTLSITDICIVGDINSLEYDT